MCICEKITEALTAHFKSQFPNTGSAHFHRGFDTFTIQKTDLLYLYPYGNLHFKYGASLVWYLFIWVMDGQRQFILKGGHPSVSTHLFIIAFEQKDCVKACT